MDQGAGISEGVRFSVLGGEARSTTTSCTGSTPIPGAEPVCPRQRDRQPGRRGHHRRHVGRLGGAGDRRLFAVQRELADVIVVGAGTARAENYGGARMSVAQRRRRQARGQSEVPPIALVTRSGGA